MWPSVEFDVTLCWITLPRRDLKKAYNRPDHLWTNDRLTTISVKIYFFWHDLTSQERQLLVLNMVIRSLRHGFQVLKNDSSFPQKWCCNMCNASDTRVLPSLGTSHGLVTLEVVISTVPNTLSPSFIEIISKLFTNLEYLCTHTFSDWIIYVKYIRTIHSNIKSRQ